MKRLRKIASIVAALFICAAAGCAQRSDQTADAALRALDDAYVEAWRIQDPAEQEKAVLSLFDNDAVIMPGGGVQPEAGVDSLQNFWFPEGQPPKQVSHFTHEIDQIEASESLAVVAGRFTLSFTYEGQSYGQAGNYLFVAGKNGDTWRIKRMIWNDQPLTEV